MDWNKLRPVRKIAVIWRCLFKFTVQLSKSLKPKKKLFEIENKSVGAHFIVAQSFRNETSQLFTNFVYV